MDCLTTSFTRCVGREYNFICPSKSVSEKQWIPRRALCYLPTSTNSSQCRKFTTMAYPVSSAVGRRSCWRSFSASLNLEDGLAPSNSMSSSLEQTSDAGGIVDGDASEKLLSRQLNSNSMSSSSEQTSDAGGIVDGDASEKLLSRQLNSNTMSSSSEQISDAGGIVDGDASEKLLSRQLNSYELKSLFTDSERRKLLKKLSEANQYNRFLKRQLQIKDDTVVKFKSELAVLELELQALVGLAEEIANFDVPSGSRKINGKYIQSHLFSRLEAVHGKVMEQIKDVDSLKPREIAVYWVGMAENAQIMGSFDGWSQGEAMSMEYSGDYARFSTTLKLRPGRYEIKFLVDGDWRLSPDYPIAGEGLTQNNILVVE